jgi:hypothetical protein
MRNFTCFYSTPEILLFVENNSCFAGRWFCLIPHPLFFFIPEVDPTGGIRFEMDLAQLFLARMLAFCGQVVVALTHMLAVLSSA